MLHQQIVSVKNRLLWQEKDTSLMNLAQQKLGTYIVIQYMHTMSLATMCTWILIGTCSK